MKNKDSVLWNNVKEYMELSNINEKGLNSLHNCNSILLLSGETLIRS